MPEYTFVCTECRDIFSVFMPMKKYIPKQKCPVCKKTLSVHRHYETDLSHITTSVKKGDDELKIGHLAARNTERMSSDEKADLTRKHNEYKYQESEKELPKGMTRLGKDPEKRKLPATQRKRDIKPRKRHKSV